MRLSVHGFKPYNNLPSSAATPHVTQQLRCTCTLTQRVNFTSNRQLMQQLEKEEDDQYNNLNLQLSTKKKKDEFFTGGSVRLGKRWPEYQGVRDWAGLLDPLDDNLRAEILRYGRFVEAAYRAFEFDPSSSSYASCKYPKRCLLEECGFPSSGYRVTTNLRATSGIRVPSWARATQSSWIGYVAVSHDKAEIARLGRRDVVIALRGTATCLEWLENLCATLTPVESPASPLGSNAEPMVERGFLSLYSSRSDTCPSLQETIRGEVARILELYPNETLSLTLTGHSLGAALATLAAYDIKTAFAQLHVAVISFGGPRVGNSSFCSLLEEQGTKILRIVNPNDLVTKVPGFVIDNDDDINNHDSNSSSSSSNSSSSSSNNTSNNNNQNMPSFMAKVWPRWIQKKVEETQWVYAEIGCELRLENDDDDEDYESWSSSKSIGWRLACYLSSMNLAKCHDLKTYLKLVQHLSSKCPLRAAAKGLLNKHQHEYGHSKTSVQV